MILADTGSDQALAFHRRHNIDFAAERVIILLRYGQVSLVGVAQDTDDFAPVPCPVTGVWFYDMRRQRRATSGHPDIALECRVTLPFGERGEVLVSGIIAQVVVIDR